MNIIEEDIQEIVKNIGSNANVLSGKTFLISGGAGFLGSYFLLTINELNKSVLKKPCKVISIDNYITGKKRKALESIDTANIKLITADVTKPLTIKEDIDIIVHAAGLASPFYYQKYPIETIESAIFGAKNLLELAKEKKVASFLYFSSSEVYGDPDPRFIPTPELYRGNVSTTGPRACYDESKRLGETLCMTYYSLYNVPVKIVRPFNIYGPGMHSDDYRVVPNFISSALKGNLLTVYNKGEQTRSFCYISDAIIGFFKVVLSKENGEIFNVGNGEHEIDMLGLAKQVKTIINNKLVIKKIPYPKDYPQEETMRRCPDLSKLKKRLAYEPKVSLEEGLRRTIAWYREDE